jgi:DNA-binding response OmpR family regulator
MKILIIDDDSNVRYTLARILGRAGYEVVIAGDGEQGISTFYADSPDLVITDLIMPRQGGIETIVKMRQMNSEMKIIAISGGDRTMNADGLVTALEAGADEVIIKPFRPEDLLSKVSQFDPAAGTAKR